VFFALGIVECKSCTTPQPSPDKGFIGSIIMFMEELRAFGQVRNPRGTRRGSATTALGFWI
jgi:hypothetical protein